MFKGHLASSSTLSNSTRHTKDTWLHQSHGQTVQGIQRTPGFINHTAKQYKKQPSRVKQRTPVRTILLWCITIICAIVKTDRWLRIYVTPASCWWQAVKKHLQAQNAECRTTNRHKMKHAFVNSMSIMVGISTYYNIGFIHIYSHTSILHIILPFIKPVN